jgi:haloalkane dehalogenase
MESLRTPQERFADLPGHPYEARYVTLPDGLRMHYVDEGPANAEETVLLLHGQPTWSYLYRKVIERLVGHGLRAVAPDLVGFGRSDKPVARTAHSVPAHADWMARFTDMLGLNRVTLVVQDWGGPIGLAALAARPEMAGRIVATNTAVHTAEASLAGHLAWPVHEAGNGSVVVAQTLLDYQRLTQEVVPFASSLFVQGATTSDIPDAYLDAYDAPFPDETFAAGPRQLPLLMGTTPHSACARINLRTVRTLSALDRPLPLLTAFSDQDPGTAGWADVLTRWFPGATGQAHVTIEGAGHFVQEDRGPELADVVALFIGAAAPR